MRSFSSVIGIGALVALGSAFSEPLAPTPAPGAGKRNRPSPAYQPKTPQTALDFARIEAAERKRARKAAKLHDTTDPLSRSGRDQ